MICFTGGGGATNGGFVYVALKPLDERKIGAPEIINRLRPKLNHLQAASVFLQAAQDLRIGGRGSNALYQYTLQSDSFAELAHWGPIILKEMKHLPGFTDVNSDQQNGGRDVILDLRPRSPPPGSASRSRPSTRRSTARSASRRSPSSIRN